MLATDHALSEFTLSAPGARAMARRAAIPALIALGAGSAVMLAGRRLHVIGEALRRVLHADVGWAALAGVFECVSLVGYVSCCGWWPKARHRGSARV